ncbi:MULTISPECIES: autotransporter assembly complex family protein [unclassified Xanthobacter]|uniref:autotransporter assembly complex protein TamA n=1 Tax=Xanthobacter TaxID=279 RepID=UPI001F26B659|nr:MULTISPECIES: autotransporter assembly complex family protein [unclassified Xanthobacter]
MSCLRPFAIAAAVTALGVLPAQADEGGLLDPILNFFNPNREKDEGPVIDAVPYTVDIEVVDADRSVRNAVLDASTLESLKNRPPAGAAGLVRRVTTDRERIIAALYSNGFYGGTMEITISGNRVDTPNIFDIVEASRKRGPVPVKIVVNPGPQFTFGTVRIVDATTHQPLPDVPSLRALRMESGEPARADAIVATETTLSNHLRELGYPFAKVADKQVVADHATNKLNVTIYVATGRQATFGDFTVVGADFLPPGFIEERIEIRPGEPFSPQRLAALRTRLSKIEAISSIRIREADHLTANGELPITIEVTARAPRYVGFSAKYSNTDGSSLNGYWGHRNLFGGGETLRLDASVSWFGQKSEAVPDADPFGYKVAASFTKPGIITANDDLVAEVAGLREVTNAYVREGGTFVAGVRRRFNDQFSAQLGVDLEDSTVQDADGTGDYFIFGVPVNFNFDNTDSPLDPSRGMRLAATVEPFAYLGDDGAGPVMAKATLSAYHAFDEDKRYILAGRVSTGGYIGADLTAVPAQRRFYVGGGGSLRGYDYQSVSPRNAFGVIIGGLSYFEASAEMRVRITDTIGIVPFLDMGAAYATEYPDFSVMKYSAGLGLRYYTAIGPLRLDLAIPLNPGPDDGSYGVYVSLGQAF